MLWSADADSTPARTAVLAGVVVLLQRRQRTPCIALVRDPERAARFHPELEFRSEDGALSDLTEASLLCLTGRIATHADSLRAARLVALAKLARVPVALVGVSGLEDPTSISLGRDLLAQAEALSAADAGTARRLGEWRGRRVETVAPPEILLAGPRRTGSRPLRIGIDLAGFSAPELDPVLDVLIEVSRTKGTALSFLHSEIGAPDVDVIGVDHVEVRSLAALVSALDTCDVLVCGPSSELEALALARDVRPLFAGEAASLLSERIGLVPPEGLGAALEHGLAIPATALRARVAPLRSVCLRALGTLAEAARSTPLRVEGFDAPSRGVLAEACALASRPHLERGDAVSAEAILEPWKPLLAGESRWAVARAQAASLLGSEAEAVAYLESASVLQPGDPHCLFALARAWTRRGDLKRAGEIWAELEVVLPEAPEPHYERACLSLLRGDLNAAVAAWGQALRRQPDHQPSQQAIRSCLDSDPSAERAFWESLCGERPEIALFWHAAALAAGRAEDWAAASTFLQRAAALDPCATEIWEALGRALAGRDAEGARRIVERARSLARGDGRPVAAAGAGGL